MSVLGSLKKAGSALGSIADGIYDTLPSSLRGSFEAYTGKTNAEIEKQNLALAKQQFEYAKGVQQRTWEREDTAVQRRTADLLAAGLSPVLAAGSAATAGPVVSTSAPKSGQTDYSGIGTLYSLAYNLLKMKADISKTYAENALIRSQKDKTTIDNARNLHNLEIEKKTDMHTNPSTFGKIGRDLGNVIDDLKGKIGGYAEKEKSKTGKYPWWKFWNWK